MDFKQVSHKRGKVTAERRCNTIEFSSLLFIEMMFALCHVNGKFVLFADDTHVFYSGQDIGELLKTTERKFIVVKKNGLILIS